jgi:aminoglycoside phosphotransferase (APT) family kinase protein
LRDRKNNTSWSDGTNGTLSIVNADVLTDSILARVDGGLINAVYRVTTMSGDTYALRVYVDLPDVSARSRFDRETALLAALAAELPVPRPIVMDASGSRFERPFMLYPWIEGVTLNECRRTYGAEALHSVAHDLGNRLGAIASTHVRLGDTLPLDRLSITDSIQRAHALLERSLARERLGGQRADALRTLLDAFADVLIAHDNEVVLVHNDLSGRNILVRHEEAQSWNVAAVLDWESASIGSPLWDLGSLFRYARRYSRQFRVDFARGYGEVFRELPDDWWFQSRLLDATRLVGVLAEERDLASVFDDCREVVARLVEPTDEDR